MLKLMRDVADFHRAGDVPIKTRAKLPDGDRARLRCDLIEEEAAEFAEAVQDHDLVGAADALADLIYVAVGAALEFGIPLDEVWNEVHRSNMAKVDQTTGKIRRRADGKILKPKDWAAPEIMPIIVRAQQRPGDE